MQRTLLRFIYIERKRTFFFDLWSLLNVNIKLAFSMNLSESIVAFTFIFAPYKVTLTGKLQVGEVCVLTELVKSGTKFS